MFCSADFDTIPENKTCESSVHMNEERDLLIEARLSHSTARSIRGQ